MIANRCFQVCATATALVYLLACSTAVAQSTNDSLALQQPAAKSSPVGVASNTLSVAAKVNGETIYRADIDRAVAALSRNTKIDANSLPIVQATILDRMLDQTLLRAFLSDNKLMPSKADVDGQIEQIRAKLKQQNMTLDDFLSQTHQSEGSFRNSIIQELAWNKYVASQATDEVLEKFFADNHEKYDGTQRRASHILLRPEGVADQSKLKALKDQAAALREKINSKAITFEQAAEEYSAGPSRSHGGDIGYFPIQGVMLAPFSQAAFALPQGEISQPVQTFFGIHLIKVTDIKPGKRTLKDAHDAVLAGFSEQLQKEALQAQRQKTPPEFTADFPHFKPGTTELAAPADMKSGS